MNLALIVYPEEEEQMLTFAKSLCAKQAAISDYGCSIIKHADVPADAVMCLRDKLLQIYPSVKLYGSGATDQLGAFSDFAKFVLNKLPGGTLIVDHPCFVATDNPISHWKRFHMEQQPLKENLPVLSGVFEYDANRQMRAIGPVGLTIASSRLAGLLHVHYQKPWRQLLQTLVESNRAILRRMHISNAPLTEAQTKTLVPEYPVIQRQAAGRNLKRNTLVKAYQRRFKKPPHPLTKTSRLAELLGK